MALFEIEQKYRVRNPEHIRKQLKAFGIRKIKSGREHNEFFDFRGMLQGKKLALRLRRSQNANALLTLKGPRLRHRYSKRFELQMPVSYRGTKTMLRFMGFHIVKQYTKKAREEFQAGSARIFLDYIPKLGWFLEIEGTSEQISRLSRNLGLKTRDREERSYLQLLSRPALARHAK